MSATEAQGFVDGLRLMADFLERHPEFVPPLGFDACTFADERERFASLARSLGGSREKRVSGSFYEAARRFGPHKVTVNISRDKVCRQVVVGERVIPAREEHIEEIVDWVCDDPVIVGREAAA